MLTKITVACRDCGKHNSIALDMTWNQKCDQVWHCCWCGQEQVPAFDGFLMWVAKHDETAEPET